MTENKNFEFMAPFSAWLQSLPFPNKCTFKKQKSNLTTNARCYATLSNHGKSVKITLPTQLWAKIQRINEGDVGFEVVNTFTHKRYLFEYHQDDIFPYRSNDLDSEEFKKEVHNYQALPYEYDEIISYGAGYREIPSDDNSPIVDTYSYGHRSRSKQLTPVPILTRLNEDKEQTKNLNGQRPLTSEEETEYSTLKQINRKNIAQLLLYEFTNENLSSQLQTQKNGSGFNIYNYEFRKMLSRSTYGTLYVVEDKKSLRPYVLKESLVQLGDPTYALKESQISNELEILKELKKNSFNPDYLLQADDLFVEKTPIRTSYYILSEPAIFNLEEIFPSKISNLSAASKRKLLITIIGQILSGLSFLKDMYHRIHGNLSLQNILIGSDGFVKLSCFELSYKTGSEVPPLSLSSGTLEEDLLYKHVAILEKIEAREQAIKVNSNLDLWSLGCIVYRLTKGTHLFEGSKNSVTSTTIFESLTRSQIIEFVSDFMALDYNKEAEREPSVFLQSVQFQDSLGVNVTRLFRS